VDQVLPEGSGILDVDRARTREPGHFSGTYIPFLGPVALPGRTSPSDYLIQRVNRTLNGLLSPAQPRIRRQESTPD
jgi:hypothetical protein